MRGQDLIHAVEIPATEAMLGTTVTVPTLEDEREIELPPEPSPAPRGAARGRAARAPAAAGRPGDRLNVIVPTNLCDEQREIARLDDSLEEDNLGPGGATASSAASAAPSVDPAGGPLPPEQAELVLAELTVLAPNGVEEERGPGYVEYAIYGGEGELPELGELDAAVGEGRSRSARTEIPDDWADRWQDFHKPAPGRRAALAAPVLGGAPRGDGRPRRRPRPGLRHRRPPDHPALPRVPAGARGGGRGRRPADRPRHRLRRARDRRREARLVPGARLRPRGPALEAAAANAAINGVELDLERLNLREQLPPLAPTTVANLTAPILRAVAAQLGRREIGEDSPEPPRCCSDESSPAPATLVSPASCQPSWTRSPRRFARRASARRERRRDGDWAALLLRRP